MMLRSVPFLAVSVSAALLVWSLSPAVAQSIPAAVVTQGGPLPTPLPLFPADNWWNLDISSAPVDANSLAFISFIGPTRGLRPDFGGEASPGSVDIYGFPFAVVYLSGETETVVHAVAPLSRDPSASSAVRRPETGRFL